MIAIMMMKKQSSKMALEHIQSGVTLLENKWSSVMLLENKRSGMMFWRTSGVA